MGKRLIFITFILILLSSSISVAGNIKEVWQYKTGGSIFSSPVATDINNDGKLEVIIGSNDCHIHVVDLKTGEPVWSYKTGDKVISAPAVGDVNGDGKLEVVATSLDHFVHVLNGSSGELIWKFDGKEWLGASPTICDIEGDGSLEVLVASQKGNIFLLKGTSGSVIWTFSATDAVTASTAVADLDSDGICEVVAGSWDNKIYCINGKTGKQVWQFETKDDIVASPVLGDINGDGHVEVIAASYDMNVYALEGESGKLLWQFTTGDAIDTTPSIGDVDGDGVLDIVFGSYDNFIYVVNGKTGALVWKQATENWISATPLIADIDGNGVNDVLASSWDEVMYVLNGKDGMSKDNFKFCGRLLATPLIIDAGSNALLVLPSEEGKVCLLLFPSDAKITWGKFQGDSWNTGFYKQALSYGLAANGGVDKLYNWGPEGYKISEISASIEVAISKPVLSDGSVFETSEGRLTLEGTATAEMGLGGFEILSYVGKDSSGNPDWAEKGPQAVGKQEYFFTQDVELQVGLNNINIRVVDSTGKEIVKEFSVLYQPKEGEKWAVVIGISEYANEGVRDLTFSASDAQGVYNYLTGPGGFPKDNVVLLLNEEATLKNIKSSLGKFLKEKAMKGDLVFMYYSGHGAPELDSIDGGADGLSKYIVTHDADPDDLYSTALPMDEISRIFGRIASERVVFFIDSCYSGSAGGKTFFSDADVGKAENISDEFLKTLESSGTGRIVITASSANEVALESNELGHGVFTYFLLEGLKGGADLNNNGFITVDEVYDYVHSEVAKESENQQHPVKMSQGQVEGEIILGNTLK